MNSGRSVRLVPVDVWKKVSQVFPDAISHVFEPVSEFSIGNCVQCFQEKQEESLFPDRLDEWKNKISLKDSSLSDLLLRCQTTDKYRNYPLAMETFLQQSDSSSETSCKFSFYIVHHFDVQRWRGAVDIAIKAKKSNKKNDNPRKRLKELLFAPKQSSPSDREWKLRSLICAEHKMTVGVPQHSSQQDVSAISSWLENVKQSNLELLEEKEYRNLVDSLSSLETILHGDCSLSQKEDNLPVVSIFVKDGEPKIIIEPRVCFCGCNVTVFSDEYIENGMVLSKKYGLKSSKLKETIECVDEDSRSPLWKMRVYEIEDHMNPEVAASQIISDLSISLIDHSSSSTTRKTRRKRKMLGEFPIYEVEMSPDGNLAHLRLLFHQSTTKKLHGQRLFQLHLSAVSSADAMSVSELTHESNSRTLSELFYGSSRPSESSTANNQEENIFHLMMSYNSGEPCESSKRPNTRKRQTQSDLDEEEHILSSLTELAYGGLKTDDVSNGTLPGKMSKKRRQEKGFRGTFLQSSSTGLSAQDELGEESEHPLKLPQNVANTCFVSEPVGSSEAYGEREIPESSVCPPERGIRFDEETVILDLVDSKKGRSDCVRHCSIGKQEIVQGEKPKGPMNYLEADIIPKIIISPAVSNGIHGSSLQKMKLCIPKTSTIEKKDEPSHNLSKYHDTEFLREQVRKEVFEAVQRGSEMTREGIHLFTSRNVIAEEVRRYDPLLLTNLREELSNRVSNPVASESQGKDTVALRTIIQEEIRQRIFNLISKNKL